MGSAAIFAIFVGMTIAFPLLIVIAVLFARDEDLRDVLVCLALGCLSAAFALALRGAV